MSDSANIRPEPWTVELWSDLQNGANGQIFLSFINNLWIRFWWHIYYSMVKAASFWILVDTLVECWTVFFTWVYRALFTLVSNSQQFDSCVCSSTPAYYPYLNIAVSNTLLVLAFNCLNEFISFTKHFRWAFRNFLFYENSWKWFSKFHKIVKITLNAIVIYAKDNDTWDVSDACLSKLRTKSCARIAL